MNTNDSDYDNSDCKSNNFFSVLQLVNTQVVVLNTKGQSLNSLRLSDVYMRQWTGSSLIQVMALHLFGDKPLHQPMLTH